MSDSKEVYNNFIGIDIGKVEFVITVHLSNKISTYKNNPDGIEKFYQEYQDYLKEALVVLETTGGYELNIINYLQSNNIAVHRAHARQVKNFINSYAINGKSDKIDAKALALYSCERHNKLKLYEANKHIRLRELNERRSDLIKMRTQELNRQQSPNMQMMQSSFEKILLVINEELELLEEEMQNIINEDQELLGRFAAICEISGIKSITARALLATIPELGSLNQKQIASLAGLAPHPRQSGLKEGYRKTVGGRREVKQILYMSALSAARSKGKYGIFYRDLIVRGKKPIVALVALMRKMIVIANAKIKELSTQGGRKKEFA